ncbi:unnamed protein product [Rotaria magnacalcarata]|uniref:Uncharacterized protein n=2 Tax=Rotaria magnacalcarata TaxID=392030 RepID=A0A816MWQ2_9BILA|nr:unnamed protein product [Rotaria magnacalcarata]CAF2138680.1 unnamed protein product [Rotaria magnacalcarata]
MDQAFILSNQQGIERVRQGGFAFFLESTMNDYVNERWPCNTIRIGENINTEDYGIATPLGSDLREVINIAVVELAQIGFLKQLKKKWFNERSECKTLGTRHKKFTEVLNFHKVAGIFVILFIGVSLAILIALFEFLVKTKRDSTRINQNICKVLCRNLCIAIKGMTLDEKKEALNNWLLQQHNISLPYRQNINQNERPVATATATKFSWSNDDTISN